MLFLIYLKVLLIFHLPAQCPVVVSPKTHRNGNQTLKNWQNISIQEKTEPVSTENILNSL